jgi:hypothetical protein
MFSLAGDFWQGFFVEYEEDFYCHSERQRRILTYTLAYLHGGYDARLRFFAGAQNDNLTLKLLLKLYIYCSTLIGDRPNRSSNTRQ